ncbi:MAG: nucleotidyltransferase domain-containing protein [Bacteroidetes bacterium]|nr:MAG: nucleotidyltransferase domain-containing protein [Bacteroidota bacterium]
MPTEIEPATAPPQPCPVERALLRALWYFDIFRHPLTAVELREFSNCVDTPVPVIECKLDVLVTRGQVFRFGRFYQGTDDPTWVVRRKDFNERADRFIPIAHRMARFIGAFPFVRAVFVSGSLSKHCMAPDGDIDFFIITTPGKLWLARTLLVVFKKLLLFNSHKYFCVNYFIDTQHLEIEEKNLFTATETVTLLPLYGSEWYEQFCRENHWAWTYYPNYPQVPASEIPTPRMSFFKRSAEWMLQNRLGHWLDERAMYLTVGYWRRKFRHFDRNKFDNALKSRRYMSKHHPLYFQEKVMKAFEERANGAQL